MKKPTLYILGGILFLSMAANAWQYVAHQSQVAQQATILADLQGQMESASQDLADAKMNLAKLEQDHATLLSETAILQAEIDAAYQQDTAGVDATTQDVQPQKPPAESQKPAETQKPSGGTTTNPPPAPGGGNDSGSSSQEDWDDMMDRATNSDTGGGEGFDPSELGGGFTPVQ